MLPTGSYSALLREPITSKNSFNGVSDGFIIGSSAMQGWRAAMEDAHSIYTGLPKDPISGYFAVFDGQRGANAAYEYTAFLREPITSKHSFNGVLDGFIIGSSAMQGWRAAMEDAHSIYTGLPKDPISGYFAVFDGHGGANAAYHLNNNLHQYITSEITLMEGNIRAALIESFLKLDIRMQNNPFFENDSSGSTAIVVLTTDDNTNLYCANVGDSRAVACIRGVAVPLSADHKLSLQKEKLRIVKAGGHIEIGRVNGHNKIDFFCWSVSTI